MSCSTNSYHKSRLLLPGEMMTHKPSDAPKLLQTPSADRPRERLFSQGAGSLRLAELLAILIRSGRPGESALQAGEKIAACFADRLEDLAAAGKGELAELTAAIGPTAYCQI